VEAELPSTERSGILDLYSLSYAYYPVFGFLVAILFGSAISFLTGKVTAASRQTLWIGLAAANGKYFRKLRKNL